MAMKLIAVANVMMIQYLITSYYNVPYKWAWLVVTAIILPAILLWRSMPPNK
ncbi:MAG: hypothetical protein HZC48_07375 [Nitrospirae bacterium]|nr:hypothetical protein [Nitrospirota bacterium]MBI5675628.1 hypothetical protein [Nitrospirota bacterium]